MRQEDASRPQQGGRGSPPQQGGRGSPSGRSPPGAGRNGPRPHGGRGRGGGRNTGREPASPTTTTRVNDHQQGNDQPTQLSSNDNNPTSPLNDQNTQRDGSVPISARDAPQESSAHVQIPQDPPVSTQGPQDSSALQDPQDSSIPQGSSREAATNDGNNGGSPASKGGSDNTPITALLHEADTSIRAFEDEISGIMNDTDGKQKTSGHVPTSPTGSTNDGKSQHSGTHGPSTTESTNRGQSNLGSTSTGNPVSSPHVADMYAVPPHDSRMKTQRRPQSSRSRFNPLHISMRGPQGNRPRSSRTSQRASFGSLLGRRISPMAAVTSVVGGIRGVIQRQSTSQAAVNAGTQADTTPTGDGSLAPAVQAVSTVDNTNPALSSPVEPPRQQDCDASFDPDDLDIQLANMQATYVPGHSPDDDDDYLPPGPSMTAYLADEVAGFVGVVNQQRADRDLYYQQPVKLDYHGTIRPEDQGRSLFDDTEITLWDSSGWKYNEMPRLSAYVCEILISLDHGPNPMFTAFPIRLHDVLFPQDGSQVPPNLPTSIADLQIFHDKTRRCTFRDELIQYIVSRFRDLILTTKGREFDTGEIQALGNNTHNYNYIYNHNDRRHE